MQEREPAVIDVVAERIRSKTPEHSRGDPYKVGLVVEGGGMRGVIGGGMVTALEALSAKSAFDAFYTVSAGAASAAHLISGQTPQGTSVYYQEMNTPQFISWSRSLRGQPIVDLEYITQGVFKEQKPLDWQKVAESPTPLHIYITSAKEPSLVDVSKFST